MSYRFRVDEGKLVLQVVAKQASYSYGHRSDPEWRDATVEDIPVADPFRKEQPEIIYSGPHPGEVL